MFIRRCAALFTLCVLAPGAAPGDEPKEAPAKDTWAKVVTDLVTPAVSKKGVEIQSHAAVPGDFELNLDVKKLGAEGKFSAKRLKEKYGPPAKVERYATREGGKVVRYEKWSYPPVAFTIPAGGDRVTTISAPKRLRGGAGILGNAKAALKGK